MNCRKLVSLVAFCLSFALTVGCSSESEGQKVLTSEIMLRSLVLQATPMPTFAKDALGDKKCGVVVLGISLLPDGTPAALRILESPSVLFGDPIIERISHWKFKDTKDKRKPIYESKLTFYLVRGNKEVETKNPSDVGFLGSCAASNHQMEKP